MSTHALALLATAVLLLRPIALSGRAFRITPVAGTRAAADPGETGWVGP